MAEAKGLELILDLAPVELTILTEKRLFEAAVGNIVNNELKKQKQFLSLLDKKVRAFLESMKGQELASVFQKNTSKR